MADFIHYAVRHIKQNNYDMNTKNLVWFSENQPEDQGFDRPFFHATRRSIGPSARIKLGDTIWIFSQLQSSRGNLFSSLDAKIVVEEVIKQDDKMKYIAGNASRWFPLFDATTALKKILTKSVKWDDSPLFRENVSIGLLLRSIREMIENSPLLELEKTINNSGFYFISYRIADGARLAFDFCKNLTSENIPIFWGRWSLPRRLAERREKVSNEKLDNYLQSIIKIPQCLQVYGIESRRIQRVSATGMVLGKGR